MWVGKTVRGWQAPPSAAPTPAPTPAPPPAAFCTCALSPAPAVPSSCAFDGALLQAAVAEEEDDGRHGYRFAALVMLEQGGGRGAGLAFNVANAGGPSGSGGGEFDYVYFRPLHGDGRRHHRPLHGGGGGGGGGGGCFHFGHSSSSSSSAPAGRVAHDEVGGCAHSNGFTEGVWHRLDLAVDAVRRVSLFLDGRPIFENRLSHYPPRRRVSSLLANGHGGSAFFANGHESATVANADAAAAAVGASTGAMDAQMSSKISTHRRKRPKGKVCRSVQCKVDDGVISMHHAKHQEGGGSRKESNPHCVWTGSGTDSGCVCYCV